MGKTATATITLVVEYDVQQTFEDDMSIHDMRDNWDEFIELPEGCMPKEWEYCEVTVGAIECEGEELESW
tara:strand:- start:86 stop:295 length:210 start_codon:yes stop_codon:yes gene_type:complete